MVKESGCCKANEPNHWAFFINHPDSNYLPTSESDSLLKKMVDDLLRHWKGMGKDEHDVKKKKKKKNTTTISSSFTLKPSVRRVTSVHSPQGLCKELLG
jgi:hypothetical protein